MFRDCYFKYAGIYSGDYNLKLMYLDDTYNRRKTGGDYTTITDDNNFTEQLLYGRKNTPLTFNIEIINCDKDIPFEQMSEIRQWLFNQPSGQWNKFRIYDEDYEDIIFYCVLIPNEDACDSQGYRGIRCSVQCNSPFGYKEVVTKSIAKTTSLQSDKKAMNLTIDCDIATQDTLPMVKIYTNKSTAYIYNNRGIIINKTNGTSMVVHNIQGSGTSNNITTVNCQSGVITNTLNQEQWLILGLKSFNADDGITYTINSGLLKLDKGKNDLVFYGLAYKIEVLYRPTVRVGAF